MRKLKLQVQTSIDGFIADKNGKTDWMIWNWGPSWSWDNELKKYFTNLTNSVDTILLSRKMAEEGFINHWTDVSNDRTNPQSPFAKAITAARKVVFTKTLHQSEWPNTELAQGDIVTEIHALKNQPGKDIIVYGGATFVSSLIKAQLIEEFYFFINPTILGTGMTIFKDITDAQHIKPVYSKPFTCGVTVSCYKHVPPDLQA